MSRQFILVTQEEIDAKLVENIKSRELELMSYDFEKANHEAAIVALGNIEWDSTTEAYKGLDRDKMIAKALEDGKDSVEIKKIGDLLALDFHKRNLEAVKTETSKSERHYDNLLVILPEGEQRDIAITAFKAKEAEKVLAMESK